VPPATTVNVAVCPAVTVWFTGWLVIAGAVVLLTVTVTLALVALFPAASFAIAFSVCGPPVDFVVSHDAE
jgi:hypothetical protein